MIKLITQEDDALKKQMEFLLGKEIPLTAAEVNHIAHLSVGHEWVLKVLDTLGLTVEDIIYEQDRQVLYNLMSENDH